MSGQNHSGTNISKTQNTNISNCSSLTQKPQTLIKINKLHQLTDEQFLDLHDKVINSGHHNFEVCKVPLNTRLNIPFFRFMLSDYEDKTICEYLEYGFPIGFTGTVKLNRKPVKNHKGAREFPREVEEYLKKEKNYDAILGPFETIPFVSNFCISPLNTVSKKDTVERRVILDLSFPAGSAINESIPKEKKGA